MPVRRVVITIEAEDNSPTSTISIDYPRLTSTSTVNLEDNSAVKLARQIESFVLGIK